MCGGHLVFKEKKEKYKTGDKVYFFVKISVVVGVITEVDNRSKGVNKIMYKVKTDKKNYWREETLITNDLSLIQSSLDNVL